MILPFVIFAVLMLAGLLVALYFLYPSSKRVSTIPGLDPSSENEGNLADISKAGSLAEFLEELHDEFGPIASFWFGKEFTVSVASPGLFKETAHLFDRPGVLYANLEPLIGEQSIQFACGADGQARRKLQDSAFSHEKLINKFSLFQEVAEELSQKWSKMADSNQHVPLSVHMAGAVMKILSRFAFGDYFKDEKSLIDFRKDYDLVFDALEMTLVEGPIPPGSEKEKMVNAGLARLKATVNKMIKLREDAETEPSNKAFIDVLLEKYDNTDQLFADCITYLLGGFHTTTFFLTWLFYFLAKNPEVQEKCYNEIKKYYKGGKLDWEELKKMKYVLQTMEETQRLSRLASIAARSSTSDMMLGGHKVPKNTPIIQAISTMAVDEKLWPDPHRFDPDRFEDMSKIPRFALEPFGFAGKRKCPGYRMSNMESQAMLVVLLSNYKVSLVPGQVVEIKHTLVSKPADEIWVTLEKRK